jgi:nicotinamidase/pyrazinamidase
MKKALIIVDVQNDFCPGGNLAVADGDKVIPVINQLMKEDYDIIVATKDWHPANHKSFASNNLGMRAGQMIKLNGQDQVMWPDHCVQNSKGSEFYSGLHIERIDKVFPKGMNTEVDSYSGFFDNDKKSSTGMGEWLRGQGITEVVIVGLALDYCVKATAEDAKSLGFHTTVLVQGTKAVNLKPDDGAMAIKQLKNKGVNVV